MSSTSKDTWRSLQGVVPSTWTDQALLWCIAPCDQSCSLTLSLAQVPVTEKHRTGCRQGCLSLNQLQWHLLQQIKLFGLLHPRCLCNVTNPVPGGTEFGSPDIAKQMRSITGSRLEPSPAACLVAVMLWLRRGLHDDWTSELDNCPLNWEDEKLETEHDP